MKLCRFNEDRLGVVEGETVRDVTEALSCLPSVRYPLPSHDLLIAHLDEIRSAIGALGATQSYPIAEVKLLSPIANPGKIFAAPVNYESHLAEAVADQATFTAEQVRRIEEIGLFLKATSSMAGTSRAIEIHHPARRTDHEVELVAIIGKTCRDVSREDALSCIAAYTIGLDVTVRGPEERSLRKSVDTYSMLGPWMVTADEFGDPADHDIWLSVDGEVRQKANTDKLILDVPALIVFASSFYTLHPGDILFTGTPDGVGPIKPGETIKASVSGIGEMTVQVTAP